MLSKVANAMQKTIRRNDVWRSAQLDRCLDVDNRRGWWRLVASLDERAMAANKRLVRVVFGRCGVSGNQLALAEVRGRDSLGLCSACRCGSLLRRGENCFDSWRLI